MNEPTIDMRDDSHLMERMEDADLAQRLLARDEGALKVVIDRYGTLVHGMATRVITDPTHAEEVAQDTFLALWRRPGAFDPHRGSLQTFLLGIARNKAIDLIRREESRRRTRDALMSETEMDPMQQGPEAGLEEREEVFIALQQLSEVQREALVLAYFGGRTYREVAAELSIPEGTAKTRLRDGLTKLRELMQARNEG